MPPKGPNVVLLHGWLRDRRDQVELARIYVRLGFDVVILDLRTHGESDTRMITFGPAEGRDVVDVLAELGARGARSPDCGIIHGTSLGAAAAIYALAQTGGPIARAVVLEGAYSDSEEVGRAIVRALAPGRLAERLCSWTFTASAAVASAGRFRHARPHAVVARIPPIPLLLLVDALDEVVPSRDADALARAWPGPVRRVDLACTRHADGLGAAPRRFQAAIREFVESAPLGLGRAGGSQ